jgi:hypothetical protein
MSLLFFLLLLFLWLIFFSFCYFLYFVDPTSIGRSRQPGHEHHVVDITSGSFDKTRCGVNPHSGHMRTVPLILWRMQLIWTLIQCSVSLIARRRTISHTRATIGWSPIFSRLIN